MECIHRRHPLGIECKIARRHCFVIEVIRLACQFIIKIPACKGVIRFSLWRRRGISGAGNIRLIEKIFHAVLYTAVKECNLIGVAGVIDFPSQALRVRGFKNVLCFAVNLISHLRIVGEALNIVKVLLGQVPNRVFGVKAIGMIKGIFTVKSFQPVFTAQRIGPILICLIKFSPAGRHGADVGLVGNPVGFHPPN